MDMMYYSGEEFTKKITLEVDDLMTNGFKNLNEDEVKKMKEDLKKLRECL